MMKRQKIQLMILGILCIALLAAFFVIRNYRTKKAEQEETEGTNTILSLTKEEVSEFAFASENQSVSLVKKEDGWHSKEEDSAQLDENAVDSLLSYVLTIRSDLEIDKVTDFEQYGLHDPLATVTLTLYDGTVYELVFGHFNEITSQYYLQMNGSDTVYVLSENLGYYFQISLEDLKKTSEEEAE